MTGWQKSNVLTSSTTSRASRAVCEVSGAVVSRDDLTERVRWLLDIVEGAERDLLSELWVPETFDRIHSGVDEGGRRLPAAAAVVGQRCGWRPQFPQDMYVPSRVMRIVTAQVISTLRTLASRDAAIAAEVSGGASDGTAGLGGAFARNVHRQIARWVRLHPGVDPAGLRITTLQPVPSVARRVRLGAVDAQLATLVTSTATELTLRIKLPVRQHPDSRTDWRWVQLDIPIPQHLHHRSITGWHLPEVTLDRRGALFRFAFAETVPRPPTVADAASAVGVDWSPKDMVVAATVVRDTQSNAMYSDFRGRRFDDHGLSVKLARLQRQGQFLRRKIARLEQLIPQASIPTRQRLEGKMSALQAEMLSCGQKRARINRDLAYLAAQYVTVIARASGASIIALEDLATLEARGLGKDVNNTVAQSARRVAANAIEHIATRDGLTVVDVPPRGTSANCPTCDNLVSRPGGYHSAACATCMFTVNRDDVGAVNTAKRALAAERVTRRRGSQRQRVTRQQHRPVIRCRDKTTPTPKRRRHRRVRRTTPATTPTITRAEASPRGTDQKKQVTLTCRNTRVTTDHSHRQTSTRVSISVRDP